MTDKKNRWRIPQHHRFCIMFCADIGVRCNDMVTITYAPGLWETSPCQRVCAAEKAQELTRNMRTPPHRKW